jgi:hypothetical protein
MIPKDVDANLRWRKEILTLAGRDQLAALQLRQMCKEDMLFYVNGFCWTYNPKLKALGNQPFITYEFQDIAMNDIRECIIVGRDFCVPKSRDMGASWMGLTVFEHFWHFERDLSFLLISRNEDYVDKRGNPKSLFWKIDYLHKYQPSWLLPRGRHLGWRDPNRKMLHLLNADTGSIIDGESTTGDAGRGDRRTAMFVDEHAAFEVNDSFRVLRATRDTTDCRGFNSTPQGANNGFYQVVHKTNAKQIRLHWTVHPLKRIGLYRTGSNGKVELLDNFRGKVTVDRKGEDSRDVLYPDEYPFQLDNETRSIWYDNECARCVSKQEINQELNIDFLGSDYQYFDPEFIKVLTERYCKAPLLIGTLEYDKESLKPTRFVENAKGNLALWINLPNGRVPKDMRFIIGSDVSAGTGASNSVSSVVDRKTGTKVGLFKTPHLRPNPFASSVIALGEFFNHAFQIWDASGPTGKVFTQRIVQYGYGNIYYRRNEKKVTRKISDEPGYYLNPSARENLLEDYRSDLADHVFINYSRSGMNECLQFIRKSDGTIEHSGSANAQDPGDARTAHGDEVIADALASLGLRERRTESKSKEPEIPIGSLAWRRAQRSLESQVLDVDQIGAGW